MRDVGTLWGQPRVGGRPDWKCLSVPLRVSVKTLQPAACAVGKVLCPLSVPSWARQVHLRARPGRGLGSPAGCGQRGLLREGGTLPGSGAGLPRLGVRLSTPAQAKSLRKAPSLGTPLRAPGRRRRWSQTPGQAAHAGPTELPALARAPNRFPAKPTTATAILVPARVSPARAPQPPQAPPRTAPPAVPGGDEDGDGGRRDPGKRRWRPR